MTYTTTTAGGTEVVLSASMCEDTSYALATNYTPAVNCTFRHDGREVLLLNCRWVAATETAPAGITGAAYGTRREVILSVGREVFEATWRLACEETGHLRGDDAFAAKPAPGTVARVAEQQVEPKRPTARERDARFSDTELRSAAKLALNGGACDPDALVAAVRRGVISESEAMNADF